MCMEENKRVQFHLHGDFILTLKCRANMIALWNLVMCCRCKRIVPKIIPQLSCALKSPRKVLGLLTVLLFNFTVSWSVHCPLFEVNAARNSPPLWPNGDTFNCHERFQSNEQLKKRFFTIFARLFFVWRSSFDCLAIFFSRREVTV